jgi:predicted transcriptional regulator
MAYDLELPNGVTLTDIPDNTPKDLLQKKVLSLFPELAEKTKRDWSEAGIDTLASLGKGFGQLAQIPGQVGTLAGLTPPSEDTGLQGLGKRLEAYGEESKSPVLKAREALRNKKMQEAEGFLQEAGVAIKSTITDPALVSSFFFEQIPNLIGTGGFGALAKGGTKILMAQATEQALAKAGIRGAISGGAVMQGADIGTDTYNQIYSELKKRDPSMLDQEAQGIALAKGRMAAIEAAGISLATSKLPGGASIERALAGRALPGAGVIKGILGEAGSEAIEEGGGALAKNVNVQQVFPETDLMQGVGGAAGLGALGGALFGGAAGLAGTTPPAPNVPLVQPLQAAQAPQGNLPLGPQAPPAPPPVPPAPPAPLVNVEPVEPAPLPPTAAERALGMPGFTGAANINTELTNQFQQQRAQQEQDYVLLMQEEEKQRKAEIEQIKVTQFAPDPLQNAMIQKRMLADLEERPLPVPPQLQPQQVTDDTPPDVAQAIEEQNKLKAIEAAELEDKYRKSKGMPSRWKPEELEQMGIETGKKAALPQAYSAESNPDNLGVGNQLISQGGQPYTTKREADAARKAVPDMRVVETPNGYVLSPKTDAQLAAEAKSKLGTPSVGKKGFPMSAHEFIVAEGGLNPRVAPDTNFPGTNPKVGNRTLFQTNGLTLDQAGEKLAEAGYIQPEYTENDVLEILDKSFKTGAYTPEGYNQIGEMQTEEEKKVYERQQAEEELFIPAFDKFDYAYADDLYNQDFQTVLQIADQAGINAEAVVEDVAKAMPDGASQAQFEEAARQSLIGAINLTYADKRETLESRPGTETLATKEEQKIYNDLKGKTFRQVAEWAIKNAPDSAQKYFAKKALESITALEGAGVKFDFVIDDGSSRRTQMFGAQGVTNFIWGKEAYQTSVEVVLNGPPVMKDQLGYPSGMEYKTVLHELLHAGTRANTRFLPPNHPVIRELNELYNMVATQFNKDVKAGTLPPVMQKYYRRINNVLSSPDELISWGLTDKEVMDYLNGIKVGKETVMTKIVRIIREVLGISKPYETALDRLVKVSDKLVATDTVELGNAMKLQGYALTMTKPKVAATTGLKQQALFAKRGDALLRDTLESRKTGFYFDAKNSPLYMTRTENDVSFPTEAEARAAIAGNKIASNIMSQRDNVKEGDFVGVRQDLNIKSAPLLAIHEGKGSLLTSGAGFFSGEVQSYAPYVTLKNVHFKIRQTAREKIAQGVEQKSKMGSADGQYVKAAKPNFDGIELRFNPMREHLFVDAMGRAVKHADEVTVVAKRAFARGKIEYYGEEDVPARAGTAPTKARLMGQGEQNVPAVDPTRRISQGDQESLFSRNAGFFFDAKASPLYQKRTAEQAKAVSPQRADVAIRSNKTGQRILDKNVQLKDGQYVGVRQDINISKSTGVSVLAVHEGKESNHIKGAGFYSGQVLKYSGTATLKNVFFKINQNKRQLIAAGSQSKEPMGSADGQWVNTDNPNFDGVEFRFNPKREHLFRDVQGRVLKYADEITASGVSVFARGNIEYYGEEDVPARAGNAPTEGVLMKPSGQITPIADEPKGKISLGQQESLFSQQGLAPSRVSVPAKVGINVNQDGNNKYADKIIDGEKTYETRDSDSLKKFWVNGERVAIVKTGEGQAKAIGEVTIGKPIIVTTKKEFDKYRDETLVPKGSKFDIKEGGVKYLYPIINPERYDSEFNVGSGIVSRKVISPDSETLALQAGPAIAAAKGKVKQALQKRPPMNVDAFAGIDQDVVNGVQQVFFAPNQTIVDRLEGMKGNFFKILAQKTVDQFRAIRDVSPIGYQQARLSTAIDGALEGILFHGHVFNDGGALNIKQGTKGMLDALAPLGNEVDRFHVWMALNREAQLPEQKRSPSLANLIGSRAQFNSGTIDGKSRAEVYEKARKDLMAINKSVLNVARDTGTIDQEAYDRFASDAFYVPFYKAMEDGQIESVRTASRLTNQEFSKELKGGSDKPFGDLMENTLRNWSHILSASMKNQAAVTIVEDAMGMGAVDPNLKAGLEMVYIEEDGIRKGKVYSIQSGEMIGNGELIQMREDESGNQYPVNFTTSGKGTVNVQMDGMTTYFKVNEPLLLESIGAINYMNSNGKVTEVLRTFKNVLRFGVTASPIFKVNNLIKDSVQAAGVSGVGFNLVKNVMSGLSDSGKDSPIYQSALAGGGIFNYGSTLEGDRSKAIKKLIEKGVAEGTILDTKEKIQNALSIVWSKYEELGNKSEAANRIALYKKLMAEGKSHLEASYQARDLMDYSMQGSSGAMRWLTQVVPFLGARTIGLYKLGRDGVIPTARVFYNTVTGKESDQSDKQKAKTFSTVAMTATLASMALYLAFKDDEDFKKREQWDRDYFWWFKVPGTDIAFRIPKPFEIGAIATLAERTLEQIVDDSAESKMFTESLGKMVWQTFSLNPTPQFFKPLIDIYANKESFTNAPIETAGMERLSKQERKTDQTSPLAIALGGVSNALSNVLGKESEMSPAQIDYLIRAYLGWFGGTIQVTSQYATMPFNNGVYADADWTKRLSLGFVQNLPAVQSTYVTQFYHNNQLIQQAYADMRHYAELGESERVKEILEEKGDLIRLQSLYDQKTKVMANIRKQLLRVSDPNNDSMTGAEKKEEIERLKSLISDQAKQAEDIRKSFKK